MNVGFIPGNGPLHRAHPFTPLTLAAVLAVLAFALPAPWGPVFLCAGTLVVAIIADVPAVLKAAVVTSLPFWVFLFLIHAVFGGSMLTAVALSARITAVILAFLTLLAVLHPARLVDALVERGFPFSFAYLFAATLQAVPRLRDRGQQILAAQRCRGLRLKGSPWRRARALVPLAVPLILSALAEVDERTFALEARGMGHVTRRTPLHPATDSPLERKTRWTLLGIALAAIVFRVLA